MSGWKLCDIGHLWTADSNLTRSVAEKFVGILNVKSIAPMRLIGLSVMESSTSTQVPEMSNLSRPASVPIDKGVIDFLELWFIIAHLILLLSDEGKFYLVADELSLSFRGCLKSQKWFSNAIADNNWSYGRLIESITIQAKKLGIILVRWQIICQDDINLTTVTNNVAIDSSLKNPKQLLSKTFT